MLDPAQADLSLTKAVDNHTPDVGSNVTFTLTLSSDGPSQATNITVTDVVPSGLSYVASSITGGDVRDDSDPTVGGLTWTVNTLNSGANTTLTFQATVTGPAASSITNSAEVTAADQADPDSTPGNGLAAEDDQDSASMTPSAGSGSCPAPSLLFSDGFESGVLVPPWDGTLLGSAGDSVVASTIQANTGTYSARAETDGTNLHRASVFTDFAGQTTVAARVRIYLEPGFVPTSFTEVMYLFDGAANSIVDIEIGSDMTLYMWNDVANETYTSAATISTGVWHTLEMTAVINGVNGEARMWLDGELQVNETGKNLGTNPIARFYAGHYFSSDPHPASILYIDDAIVCAEQMAPPQVNYRSIGTATNYTTGTIDATGGSAVVDGTGTSWQMADRGRGDRIDINGMDYTILSVDSETQLTLTMPVIGSYTGIYTISRQYSTLQGWEDCISYDTPASCSYFQVASASLVADERGEIGIAYNDSIVPTDPDFTAQVLFNGSITDNTHTITLTADYGNRHYGVAGNGVMVDVGASTNTAIRVQDDWVNVEWLEIRGGSGSTARGVQVDTIIAGSKTVLRNLLIHDMPGQGIRLDDPDVDIDIYNNIIYEVAVGIRPTLAIANARILNNTIYRCK